MKAASVTETDTHATGYSVDTMFTAQPMKYVLDKTGAKFPAITVNYGHAHTIASGATQKPERFDADKIDVVSVLKLANNEETYRLIDTSEFNFTTNKRIQHCKPATESWNHYGRSTDSRGMGIVGDASVLAISKYSTIGSYGSFTGPGYSIMKATNSDFTNPSLTDMNLQIVNQYNETAISAGNGSSYGTTNSKFLFIAGFTKGLIIHKASDNWVNQHVLVGTSSATISTNKILFIDASYDGDFIVSSEFNTTNRLSVIKRNHMNSNWNNLSGYTVVNLVVPLNTNSQTDLGEYRLTMTDNGKYVATTVANVDNTTFFNIWIYTRLSDYTNDNQEWSTYLEVDILDILVRDGFSLSEISG
jgi:hypothetical protein